ncbi:MAG: hypothetical protein OQL06_04220 [Gammaproteobacteria bacterium]|nr:hypothetical protein [Gammaproteobacteria bacterium]
MNNKLPLAQDKKLTVLFKVEPGCLGPEGKDHVAEFCSFAEKEMESVDSNFVHWEILPRHDKSQPEMQYKVANKTLTHSQAEKYLSLFEKELDEFEGHLHDKLAILIDEFLGH